MSDKVWLVEFNDCLQNEKLFLGIYRNETDAYNRKQNFIENLIWEEDLDPQADAEAIEEYYDFTYVYDITLDEDTEFRL